MHVVLASIPGDWYTVHSMLLYNSAGRIDTVVVNRPHGCTLYWCAASGVWWLVEATSGSSRRREGVGGCQATRQPHAFPSMCGVALYWTSVLAAFPVNLTHRSEAVSHPQAPACSHVTLSLLPK
jgi:hypothetical protein